MYYTTHMKEGFIERVDIVFLLRTSRFFALEASRKVRFQSTEKNVWYKKGNSEPLFLIALRKGAHA